MRDHLWLASVAFDAVFPDRTRRRVQFRVGPPYQTEEPDEWACAVELRGLAPREPDTEGSDPMQALCLALSWAGRRLRELEESGVQFLGLDDSQPFHWNDYLDLELHPDEPSWVPQLLRDLGRSRSPCHPLPSRKSAA